MYQLLCIMAEGDKHLVITVRPDTADVTLKVSTGKDDPEAGTRKAAGEFPATLPKDLGSAVRLEADLNHCGLEEASKIVYKKYLLSKVIELQGKERMRLAPEGEKKERKRASYMEQLGL